jgi:hypothetical protein
MFLRNTVNHLQNYTSGTLQMDAECSSEILLTIYRTTHDTPQDRKLDVHHNENVRSRPNIRCVAVVAAVIEVSTVLPILALLKFYDV